MTRPTSIHSHYTQPRPHRSRWRNQLHEIIFEADTRAGRLFDVLLIGCILASIATVMLDSMESVRDTYGAWLTATEWTFTVLFTIEYILRLLCVGKPLKYATSFFGVVDLLATLPTWVSLLIPGSRYLMVIRVLRVLRVFRVLKLAQYLGEARLMMQALRASRRKIIVFLFSVLTLVVILGAIMYVVEGGKNGFTSIPAAIYWAIVTLTTVGYGDIAPATGLGKALACVVMIMGFGIIAVPTGIVTVELGHAMKSEVSTQACPECGAEGHDMDAVHCKYCGVVINPNQN